MTEQSKKEQLETLFSNSGFSRRRYFMFYLFIVFFSFIFGILGSYFSLVYFFPYLETKGIDVPVLGYTADSTTPIRIIEKTKEKVIIEESKIIDVVEEVSSAVVSIVSKSYYRGYFGEVLASEGAGTGFLISSDGKVLTNKHVVYDLNAEYKVLTKDGEEYNVSKISLDPISDLAIIFIVDEDGNKPDGLPVIKIGESSTLKSGQRVIAIGNALGKYDNSVTTGVISATGRTVLASDNRGMAETLKNLIQTDAAINPGNSGGPLLNITGEVIGINTAVASAQNIGFAIPVDDIEPVLRSIEAFGEIKRSYLGVSYRLIDKKIAESLELSIKNGALLIGNEYNGILAVDPKSPAYKVGLKEGDIIVKIEGEEVSKENTLIDILKKYIPEEQITLKIYRPRKVVSGREEGVLSSEAIDFIDIVVTLDEMKA